MIRLAFDKAKDDVLKILCLGAHSDDIEIGCGGTLLKLIEEYPCVSIRWVVFGSTGERTREAYTSAQALLHGIQDKKIDVKGFRDGYFPYIGAEIKDYFEALKSEVSPDLIFTHNRHDLHQDHRLISELTLNTFRSHLILEYEIPKYDGDMGAPNFYACLDEAICQRKIQHILNHFTTQKERYWFTEDTFWSLLKLRGMEARAPENLAEAFYSHKATF